METHTNYKAEFSFFLRGNIAFLCNFKIKMDQTDINPNFGTITAQIRAADDQSDSRILIYPGSYDKQLITASLKQKSREGYNNTRSTPASLLFKSKESMHTQL